MPKIQNIQADQAITTSDKFLGSDSGGGTRNYIISDVAKFFKETNAAGVAGQLTYRYDTSVGQASGHLDSPSVINLETVSTRTIRISIYTYGNTSDTRANLIDALSLKDIIIVNVEDPNNFGIYNVTNIATSGDYKTLTLSVPIAAKGSFTNTKTYAIAAYGGGSGDLTAVQTTTSSQLTITSGTGPIPSLAVVTGAIANGGTGLATADQIHTFVTTQTDTIAANTSGTAAKVTVTDSSTNTDFPLVFHDNSNTLLDDVSHFKYNPSSGSLLLPSANFDGVFLVGTVSGDPIIRSTSNDQTIYIQTQTGGSIVNNLIISPTSISGTAIKDEDNMSSNSATHLATQQSIKAYVDSQVDTVDTLSEILAIGNNTGGTKIEVNNTSGGIDFIDNAKLRLGTGDDNLEIYQDGTNSFIQVRQPLINTNAGTLYINAPIVDLGFDPDTTTNGDVRLRNVSVFTGSVIKDEDNMASNSASHLATQQSIKAYVDSQILTKDNTDEITEGSSNLYFTNERVDDRVNSLLTAGSNITLTYDDAGNALTIAAAQLTNEQVQDVIGGMLGGDETGGIAVTYDDANNHIDFALSSIPNNSLANSSVTINSNSLALGGTLTLTTQNISEGTDNLYFTNERVDDRVNALVTAGTGITSTYDDAAGTLTLATTITQYTNALARGAISVSGNALSYNSSTGVITSNFEEAPTFTGTVTAASLDISGDVDIDGTLETDALTIGGVTSVPFEAADHSKLDGIEASATADQTDAEIRAAVEAATDSNVFTDADHTKLNAIEASADVTDTTNVTAAGALMDSELTDLAAVKAINQGLTTSSNVSFGNITTTGYLRGPASFTIDPAAHGDNTGTLVIAGNLQVDGTTTTINSTTVAIDDLNFSIATDAADSAAANGAGITIGGAGATLTYVHADTGWAFNKGLKISDSTNDNVRIGTRGGNINIHSTNDAGANAPLRLEASQFNFITGNATFAGDVTATSKKFISTSSSSGDYVRLYAGSGTAQWDIYGHGENLRFSENSSGGGVVAIDSAVTWSGGGSANANTAYTYSQVGHLPLAGGTMTGTVTFNDGAEVRLGNDNDMGLFSSSGVSHIRINEGTFVLRADDLSLKNKANDETYLTAVDDGAVSIYYDNSKKFETTNAGVSVTGDVTIQDSSPQITLLDTTNNTDALIYSDDTGGINISADENNEQGSSAIKLFVDGGEKMRLDSSGRLGLGVTSLSSMFTLQGNETGGQTITHLHLNSGNNNSFPFLASLNNATISSATYGWTFNNSSSTGNLEIGRRNNSTTTSTVLTLERSTGNATFEGDVNVKNASTRIISLNYEDSINSIISHSGTNFGLESLNVRGDNIYFYTDYDSGTPKGNLTLTLDSSHNATFAGDVRINGNDLEFNGAAAKISGTSGGQISLNYNTTSNQSLIWYGGGTSEQFKVTNVGDATFAGDVTVQGGDILNASGAFNMTSAGDFVVDAVGDITLDADGGDILFKDAGTAFATFNSSSGTTFAGNITAAVGNFKAPDATASIINQFACADGNNAATFRTTTSGKIFEIRSQNSGTLKFDSTSSTFTGNITLSGNSSITAGGYLHLITAGSANAYLDAGGTIYIRDVDSGNADRVTIDTATGNTTFTGNVSAGTTNLTSARIYALNNSSSQWAGYFYNQNSAGIGLHVETNGYGTEQLLRLSSLSGSGGSNRVALSVLNNGNATFAGTVIAASLKTSGSSTGIVIYGQEIYANEDYDGDDGSIRLNRFGYQGGQTKFRDVVIYDGKGAIVAKVDGSDKSTTFEGDVTLGATNKNSHTTLNIFTNDQYISKVNYQETSGYYGFSTQYDGANNVFTIKRHSNSQAGTPVITLNRDNDNATFAGDIYGNDRLYLGTKMALDVNGTDLYLGSTTSANHNDTVYIRTNDANRVTITDTTTTFAGTVTVDGGQILTPSGINLALNPNTGVVAVGGIIQASGTGNNTFAGKVSVGGGDTSTAQVALKGQQSLLSFIRGTSGDAQFFMSSDSSRLYFSHTDIQSTNLILKLDASDKSATFNGQVTINPDADSQVIIGNGGTNASVVFAGAGDDLYIGGGNSSNMRIFNGTAVQFYGTVDIDSTLNVDGNATFAGELTGKGATFSPNTAGKGTFTLTTNASDDGRLLIKSDTTTKVDIQANGASYFNGGNVGIGDSTPNALLKLESTSTNESTAFFYSNASKSEPSVQIWQDGAGSSGAALLIRNDGSGNALQIDDGSAGNAVFSIGNTGNATFAGNVTLSSSSSKGLFVKSTANVEPFIALQRNSGSNGVGVLRLLDGGDLTFDTGATGAGQTTRLTIDGATGNATFAGHVSLADGKSGRFGDSNDLKLYHSSGSSYIENDTGDLYITQNNGSGEMIFTQNQNDGNINFNCDDGSGGITTYMSFDGGDTDINVYKDLHLADNVNIRLGTGLDARIYHDGTDTYMINATGILNILNDDIRFKTSGDETSLRAVANGAVELMYNNTTMVQTMSDGIAVPATKGVYFDGGAHTYIKELSADRLGIHAGGRLILDLFENGDSSSYIDMHAPTVSIHSDVSSFPLFQIKNTNADAIAPRLALIKDSASPADNDETGRIYMYGDNDAGEQIETFLARTIFTDVSDASEDSTFEMFTYKAGAQTSTLALASGNVGIGTTSPSSKLHVATTGTWEAAIIQSNNTTGSGVTLYGTNSGVQWSVIANASGGGAGANALGFHLTNNGSSSDATGYKMVVKSTGKVGIGTTTPAGLLNVSNGGANGLEIDPTQSSGAATLLQSYNRSGSAYTILRTNAGSYEFQIADSTKMSIDSSGNATFAGKIIPNAHIELPYTSELRTLDSGSTVRTIARASSNKLQYGWSYGGKVEFMGGGAYSPKITIDTNGKVGIGTARGGTDPDEQLHVAGENNGYDGTLKVGERAIFAHRDGGQTKTFLANNYNHDSATFGIRMKGVADSNEVMTITGAGNTTFAGTVSFNPDADSTASIKNAGTNAIALFAGSGDILYLGGNDTTGMYLDDAARAYFIASINLSDSQPIRWNGDNILSHNGTQTYLGDATSASVLTLSGGDATFAGDVDIYTGGSTGTLNVGRNSSERFQAHVTDTDITLTASNDIDENQDHNFILDRSFGGSGGNNFRIRKGGTNQLTIDKDANATFAGDVASSGNITATTSGTTTVNSVSTGNWAGMQIQSSDAASAYLFFNDTSGERARIQSTANNDLKFSTNGGGSLALTLDSSTNATFEGQLTGTGYVRSLNNYQIIMDSAHSGGPVIEFGSTSDYDAYGHIGQQNSEYQFGTHSRDFAWYNGTTRIMELDAGNTSEPVLAIGTSVDADNTKATLQVFGNNNTDGTVRLGPHSSKGSTFSHIHYGSNGDWYIRPASNSGSVFVLNYSAISDERLKENIVDSDYGLSEITSLRPRNFNWINSSTDDVHTGFVAQEVEAVVSKWITQGELDDHKSVDYNAITATLVKAVQELKAQNEDLLARVKALENK